MRLFRQGLLKTRHLRPRLLESGILPLAGVRPIALDRRTFVYDGENKQVEVKTGSTVKGQYWYDGDGKRVKKYVPPSGPDPGELTVFVYDASGKLVAEYSTVVASAEDARVAYLTADHLGSPRINTDRDGAVTARHDYHPFGEEITNAITSQRIADLGYESDSVRKQFTGYERDDETDADFAQARYYAFRLGRFRSTDPILISEDRALDPQQINLYIYGRNNPYKYVDVTGEDIDDASLKDNKDYQKWKTAFLATEDGRKLWDKYANDKNFMLTIKVDKDKGNGAATGDYKFSDGKLVGATITLGNNISDVEAGANRPIASYPITSALGKSQVDGLTMAVAVIAHEFGHVEDAGRRPEFLDD